MSFVNLLPKENQYDRRATCQLLANKALEVKAEMDRQQLRPGECFPTAGLLFAVSGFLLHDFALRTISEKMQIPCESSGAIGPDDDLSYFFVGLASHHLKCGDRLAAGVLSYLAMLLQDAEKSVIMVEWLQRYLGLFELQLESKWN